MTRLTQTSALFLFSCVLGLSGCRLPENQEDTQTLTAINSEHWIKDPDAQKNINQGLTAYLPLYDGFMSMATRLHLINKAQHNLDLQYYIWKNDEIGQILLMHLLKAADRGVKVRILIDDQNGTALDKTLVALSAHPNITIKLFNPYQFRHFRVMDYGFRLKKINHRMHNKLIVADGSVAVTGGRNISGEYFDASQQFQFTDLDIFFAGESVQQANETFQRFWNDTLSFEVQKLFEKKAKPQDLAAQRAQFKALDVSDHEVKRRIQLSEQHVAQHLAENPISWAKAHFVADHPSKVRASQKESDYIYDQMFKLMGEPRQHLELVSAYFVPTQKGTDYLSKKAQEGIKIRILTNSFLANDVALVHAYYQQYRKQLLKNGIELWEFKPYIERPERTWYEVMTGNVIPAKNKNSSSLHAKFFDIDGMVFIGSFNFDPRSVNLNTEVGLVVESDDLQNEISQNLNHYLPKVAYQLKLDKSGDIIWLEHQENGKNSVHLYDPETTKFQRWMMKTIPLFPAEWLM